RPGLVDWSGVLGPAVPRAAAPPPPVRPGLVAWHSGGGRTPSDEYPLRPRPGVRPRPARRPPPAPVVLALGHVPDRGRLLLDPRLPAVDRRPERRDARPAGDRGARAGDPVRGAAGLRLRRPPLARGAGVDRDAGPAGLR